MDELEALNMLLRAIGSSPVNSTSTNHPDAANAMETLDRYRKRVQNRGWWFNIDYNVTFQRNETNQVRIPKEYTLVVFQNPCYVQRGIKLYDKANQTYFFNENPIALRTIRTLPWEELPNSAQQHIAYAAAESFVSDELEDPNKEAKFERKAGMAANDLKKEDLEQGQYNSFNKARVQQARVGQRPYRMKNYGSQVNFQGTTQYEN